MKTVLASKTATFLLRISLIKPKQPLINTVLDPVKSLLNLLITSYFTHDILPFPQRGEEPGAQEKWMKATCSEAVYLSLGEAGCRRQVDLGGFF